MPLPALRNNNAKVSSFHSGKIILRPNYCQIKASRTLPGGICGIRLGTIVLVLKFKIPNFKLFCGFSVLASPPPTSLLASSN